MREDVEVTASHRGLTIRGETEDAIDAALVLLKDLHGPRIRIGPPTIRFHNGVSLEQPWMGLRVHCSRHHLDAIDADLIERGAINVFRDGENGQSRVQACAPLAALLGYRSALEVITSGSAQHSMWLSHYAPVESPPPDGRAA